MAKTTSITILSRTFTCILNKKKFVFQILKVNLFVATPLLKTYVNFLGGFWSAKIVKSEKSFKILKNMAKTTSITILSRTFTCILNKKKFV